MARNAAQFSFWSGFSLVIAGAVLGIVTQLARGPATTEESNGVSSAQLRAQVGQDLRTLEAFVRSQIELVRAQARLLRRAPAEIDRQDRILLLAEAPLQGATLAPIARFLRRTERTALDQGEQQLLGQAYARWLNAPIAPGAVELFPVRLSEARPEEGAWVTFLDGDSQVFAFIDVARAFTLPETSAGARAYLVSDQGSVLTHSLPRLNGTSILSTSVFSRALSSPEAVEATAWDSRAVWAQYARIGTSPVQMGVERVLVEADAGAFWLRIRDGWLAGWLSALFAAGGCFLLLGTYHRRRRDARLTPTVTPSVAESASPSSGAVIFARPAVPTEEVDSSTRLDVIAGPVGTLVGGRIIPTRPFPPELPNFARHATLPSAREKDDQLKSMREELDSYQRVLKRSQEESNLIAEFEAEAARLRDPKVVAVRMVSVAAKLCSSPALFFNYQDRHRGCLLAAESGIGPGRLAPGLGFPVNEPLVQWIAKESAEGRSPSLAEYAPLAKLLLDQLGVAHFEAWPLLGNGPLGRLSGRPRLLGVLVILQSGSDSFAQKDSLKRMLRSTGLVYENTILAR